MKDDTEDCTVGLWLIVLLVTSVLTALDVYTPKGLLLPDLEKTPENTS